MERFILDSNYLLVDDKVDNIRWGSIVVYHNDFANKIAHRVFWKNKYYIWVGGDNCRHFEKINRNDILGIVKSMICTDTTYNFSKINFWNQLCTFFLLCFIPMNNIFIDTLVYKNQRQTMTIIFKQKIIRVLIKIRNYLQNRSLKTYRVAK